MPNGVALLHQFIDCRLQFFASEGIDVQATDTICLAPVADDRHAEEDAFRDAIPAVGSAIETQRPPLPLTQSRTWSIAALAADAADDWPRASMMAVPRCATVGMKTSRFQRASRSANEADWPSTRAKR